ncbi:MAG: DUF3467 domain-containing protein [Candidatus Eisenbacteria bacterium]
MKFFGQGPQEKAPPAAGVPQQVKVELPEREAEGIYSNLVLMAHSASEFIFDFARILPGIPKAKVYARIVMTPQNAKSLLKVLQKNLESFEQKHGKIPGTGEFPPPREIGFK